MATLNVLVDVQADPAGLERLQSLPGIAVRAIEPKEETRDVPAELLRDVHILFCECPPKNFADLRSLRLIQLSTAGYERLLKLDLAGKGIRACNARGVFDVPIAEWNIAMMVNLARNLRGMIRNQEAGRWDRGAEFQREIRGSLVGLWGYGGLGRETARVAKALGMRVHALTRTGVARREQTYCVPGTGDPEGVLPDRVFVAGQEAEFLSRLDFLILAMPLTRASRGRIGEAELRALPRTAFLLNPARGPLIQEPALLRALREGWIAGAALDTHYYYPMPPEHPLWRFPNVILTPHISGSSQSQHFAGRVWEILVQNVESYVAGGRLLNELTPAQLNGE
ncbi:MAG TPA: D-2-hydroxyacid dehydrogenase [Bryobacterales bacterium]|nr:D-2-hydroxyacid dehydrogenase [Bryobacterales bacterium]